MWNEEIGVSEHMLLIARESCPILRREVAKSFLQAFLVFRAAAQWHLILLRRQTTWMLRLGLQRIGLVLASQRQKETAAYEPPLEKQMEKIDGDSHDQGNDEEHSKQNRENCDSRVFVSSVHENSNVQAQVRRKASPGAQG